MAIVWAYPLTSVASIDAIPHFFGVFIGDFSFMLYGEIGKAAAAVDAVGGERLCGTGYEAALATTA